MTSGPLRVSDIMCEDFIVIDGMATVSEALAKMAAANAAMVIVDKRNDDDEYGVVPLTRILTKVLAVNRSPERVNVYEIMLKPAVMIDADMKARYCARFFANLGIRTAPVIRDQKIVGTISYRELAYGGTFESG